MLDLVVVPNLELTKVTWAQTFITSARSLGIQVSNQPNADRNVIFLGDLIPQNILKKSTKSAYFLAAVDGLDIEERNIRDTNITIVASHSQITHIHDKFPGAETAKVIVNGFPISIHELSSFRLSWDKRYHKSVCFLGETRPEKNPRLELELVAKLQSKGYQCYHLSPKSVSIKSELEFMGATVVEYIHGKRYLNQLRHFQFVINTSYYESLFVSGIEAGAMGVIPITPDHNVSGICDWCPSSLRYSYKDSDGIIQVINSINSPESFYLDLEWYDKVNYFKRVFKAFNKI